MKHLLLIKILNCSMHKKKQLIMIKRTQNKLKWVFFLFYSFEVTLFYWYDLQQRGSNQECVVK